MSNGGHGKTCPAPFLSPKWLRRSGLERWSGFPEQQPAIVKWVGCGMRVIHGANAALKGQALDRWVTRSFELIFASGSQLSSQHSTLVSYHSMLFSHPRSRFGFL